MRRNACLKTLLLATLPFVISSGAAAEDTPQKQMATAQIQDASGNAVGTATFEQLEHGVLVNADLKNLPSGGHAFHIHEKGACQPDFKAAGGHYRPLQNEHGYDTPDGYHAGDLPNVYVSQDGTARAAFFAPDLTLGWEKTGKTPSSAEAKAPFPLMDADGSAIMIHENADDYKAVPPDSTGARIACGVIKMGDAAGQ